MFIIFLPACSDEDRIIETDDPQLVAVAFFEAIYNEKNIIKAASACSPKLARLLLHYKTPQSVARHLFNMSYDRVTQIEPDVSGIKIREIFKNSTEVTVYLSGYQDEDVIKDVKRLSLIQNDKNQWIIDKILKDPF
ncbi:hypothetical protein [Colwellia sp. 20A7]|jgi:hypothetical protein|uniref:hypothetical protein n=1 Tax=Colwellia sp. 20A7 TaxID=2689569 RepID=UPI001F1703D3|nr:hypothetical protein [Colwellia sp. 20A7]